jgi:hypothetical protein
MRFAFLLGLMAAALQAAAAPGAPIVEHMVLLQPGASELTVQESILFENTGKEAFSDPANGVVRLYIPEAAKAPAQVSITGPQGATTQQVLLKTPQRNVYQVDATIQPGQTRIDLSYSLPFSTPGVYSGKLLHTEGRLWLVAPQGVTLKGDNLKPPQQITDSQASVYEVEGREFKVEIEGAASAAADSSGQGDSGSSLDQILPQIYNNVYPILGLAFGILILGFYMLYRKDTAQAPAAPAPAAPRSKRRR